MKPCPTLARAGTKALVAKLNKIKKLKITKKNAVRHCSVISSEFQTVPNPLRIDGDRVPGGVVDSLEHTATQAEPLRYERLGQKYFHLTMSRRRNKKKQQLIFLWRRRPVPSHQLGFITTFATVASVVSLSALR